MSTTAAAHRVEIEEKLIDARLEVDRIEAELDLAKRRRDDLVVELRRVPDPPSARAVAALAGISNPWVLKLEKAAE